MASSTSEVSTFLGAGGLTNGNYGMESTSLESLWESIRGMFFIGRLEQIQHSAFQSQWSQVKLPVFHSNDLFNL